MDGDWCLVDLGDEIPEEATKVAHAMGMNFEEFLYMILEEKLQSLRNDKALMKAIETVEWTPVLSEALESLSKHALDNPNGIIRDRKPLAQTESI